MDGWILILTLAGNGRTAEVPWAVLGDPAACGMTGTALVQFLQHEIPGLSARYRCEPEQRA